MTAAQLIKWQYSVADLAALTDSQLIEFVTTSTTWSVAHVFEMEATSEERAAALELIREALRTGQRVEAAISESGLEGAKTYPRFVLSLEKDLEV